MSYANLDINSRIGAGFVVFNLSAFDGEVNGPNATAFLRIYHFTGGCLFAQHHNIQRRQYNPIIQISIGVLDQDCIATWENA